MITAEVSPADITRLLRQLEAAKGALSISNRRKLLRTGVLPIQRGIKAEAPKAAKPHKRYSGLKHGQKKRGHGHGNPIATIKPGNIRRNVQEIRNLGTTTGNVFVGIKKRPKDPSNDAFYARFQDQGTKYMPGKKFVNNGTQSGINESIQNIVTAIKQAIENAFKGIKI